MRITVEYQGQKYGARFDDTARTEAIVDAVKRTLISLKGEGLEYPMLTSEENGD